MRKANVDLSCPRMITDSGASPSGLAGESGGSDKEVQDFAFAFNDRNFSDRVLLIEIVPDSPVAKLDVVGCSTVSDWARNRKRRRAEFKRDSAEDIAVHREELVLNCNMPDTEDNTVFENQDEEAAAMNEFPSSVGVNLGDDLAWNLDCHTVVKVRTLHVSSPILAARSPFFYKLFSNGMRESEQRQVSLRIHESEEAPLMEVLNFMYSNTLSAMTPTALLDVFKVADKFEVASCMRDCSRSLQKLPMTRESALLYLGLPSSILIADAVQPLTDAAKQFLAERYKEITKFQDEVLSLPLAGIEAVLSSNDLQVASEDSIYDFVLKWARTNYPKLEERREVLGQHLGRLIRFPQMSCRKLKKVLTCSDFDPGLATKIVLEALFYKSETPHKQRTLAAADANAAYRRFVDRSYKYRPVKLVEFVEPHLHCSVFLDLKWEECARLFPAGRVYSQPFFLGGQGFFLSAHCNMDQQSSFHCFGLFLGMQEKGSASFTVDYEFSARSKPGEEFLTKFKGNYTFTGGKAVGYRNLLGIPWTAFMADDSIYFLNSVLHLKAELTIKQ